MPYRDCATGLAHKEERLWAMSSRSAKSVTFVADWFSGKNAFGYVTPGISITLPKSSLLNIGYSIGNQGRGNNALFVYYGITF